MKFWLSLDILSFHWTNSFTFQHIKSGKLQDIPWTALNLFNIDISESVNTLFSFFLLISLMVYMLLAVLWIQA